MSGWALRLNHRVEKPKPQSCKISIIYVRASIDAKTEEEQNAITFFSQDALNIFLFGIKAKDRKLSTN